jgi:hypothetical protein
VIVEESALLLCHPSTPGPAIRRIRARVRRLAIGVVDFLFCLDGDVRRLLVPPPAPAHRADLLWKHTCFEAFIAPDGGRAYRELNFSPSGEWAAYAFDAYRERSGVADTVAPLVLSRADADRLEVEATIALEPLLSARAAAPLRIGLAAVIEANDGALSYWALAHPREQPDFHDERGFGLRLEPPRSGC